MINYSVIIPHKNTPELLSRCLESIPIRDDVEIIIVDDNSDPSKVDFSSFPGLTSSNTHVIFLKSDSGCAKATNIAIDEAVGKWIVRADADDFFCDDIMMAMDSFVDSDYEIIYFKGKSITLPDMSLAHRCDTNNFAIDQAIYNNDFRYLFTNSCPWCKFYKREFLNKHQFRLHEVKWSTEVTFCAKIAVAATKYHASSLCIYCVTDSDGTMVKNNTLECRKVRFQEDCSAVKILRPLVGHFDFMHFWMFHTWYNIYKINKWEAIKQIPVALFAGRMDFIHQLIVAKFR